MDRVEAIFARLGLVRWFGAAGTGSESLASATAARDYARQFGDGLVVRWASGWDEARQVVRGLDNESSLWLEEEQWRQQAAAAAQEGGRGPLLAEALHNLSIFGYGAVRPAVADEELARVASGAALWTAAEAITWAVAEDLLAPQPNPFLPKLRLFELGHWPLGKHGGAVVVL